MTFLEEPYVPGDYISMTKLPLSVVGAFFALAFTATAKPNIIFILLTDDLGYGDVGVLFQNERKAEQKHVTPRLDQFAAEGVQMRRHYCPAPVCAPSRASSTERFSPRPFGYPEQPV